MNFKQLLIIAFRILIIIFIVLIIYFIGSSVILKLLINTVTCIYFIYDMVNFSIEYFSIFYSNLELYFIREFLPIRLASHSSFRTVLNELNFAKMLMHWYCYPKFIYGESYSNIAYHNLMNFKPYNRFLALDLNLLKNSNLFNALIYKNLSVTTSVLEPTSIDYF